MKYLQLKKRYVLCALLLVCIFVLSACSTVDTDDAPIDNVATNRQSSTRLSLALSGGDGTIRLVARNEFNLFGAKVMITIELYSADVYCESYTDMTFVESATSEDFARGETLVLEVSTNNRAKYWQGRMYYKIGNDAWSWQTTGTALYSASGEYLGTNVPKPVDENVYSINLDNIAGVQFCKPFVRWKCTMTDRSEQKDFLSAFCNLTVEDRTSDPESVAMEGIGYLRLYVSFLDGSCTLISLNTDGSAVIRSEAEDFDIGIYKKIYYAPQGSVPFDKFQNIQDATLSVFTTDTQMVSEPLSEELPSAFLQCCEREGFTDVQIYEYCGEVNGKNVFRMSHNYADKVMVYLLSVGYIVLDGVPFIYSGQTSLLYVYCNDAVYPLVDAYLDDILSYSELVAIGEKLNGTLNFDKLLFDVGAMVNIKK